MASSQNWVSRYRAGKRGEVWQELRQFGNTIREPDLVAEAQLVCDEMAHRARQNVEAIVERLTSGGFRFHTNDDLQSPVTAFVPASETAASHATWLDQTFGPVPMTLRSWVRIVGDVWLVGTHPDWPESMSADPLVIEVEGSRHPGESMRDFFVEEREIWRELSADDPEAGLFVLPLAPDRLHKANVSGGGPYGIVVPDGCVDGLFVAETTMPFVAYLNWVFGNGGFPASTGSKNQWRTKNELAKDLLPL